VTLFEIFPNFQKTYALPLSTWAVASNLENSESQVWTSDNKAKNNMCHIYLEEYGELYKGMDGVGEFLTVSEVLIKHFCCRM
jgi:hypothetical protein